VTLGGDPENAVHLPALSAHCDSRKQRFLRKVGAAIRATLSGMTDVACEELTDEDGHDPQRGITYPTDGVFDQLRDALTASL
jgi:hypothetical protein